MTPENAAKTAHADMPYGAAYRRARHAKVVFIVTMGLCLVLTTAGLKSLTLLALAIAGFSFIVGVFTHAKLYRAYYQHWQSMGEDHPTILARWKKDFPNHMPD